MAILVTGGAGYIGSATVDRLRARGEQVVVIDDLKQGHRGALDPDVPLLVGSVGNRALVDSACRAFSVDACIHFAALTSVGESVIAPPNYYENNLVGTTHLLEAMRRQRRRQIVFSSTAATYGEPQQVPIPTIPAAADQPLRVDQARHRRDPRAYAARLGFRFAPCATSTPRAPRRARRATQSGDAPHPARAGRRQGRRPNMAVFGDDYPTPDGTCLRDYIHIDDLAARTCGRSTTCAKAARPSCAIWAREPATPSWMS